MLNVNIMGFLHKEETKMSTVRATSRVQEIRNRTDAIQQKNAEKAAAAAAQKAAQPKTTATSRVQEIRNRTDAIQQKNAEKTQGTANAGQSSAGAVKSTAKASNTDTVSISTRSNSSSYAGQYKDMSDESLDKTINNLKNTIKNSKSGTATYYAQKALEGYQAEKERRINNASGEIPEKFGIDLRSIKFATTSTVNEAKLTNAKSYAVISDNSYLAGKSGYITKTDFNRIVYIMTHECGKTPNSNAEMFGTASVLLNEFEHDGFFDQGEYSKETMSDFLDGFYKHNGLYGLYNENDGVNDKDSTTRAEMILNYVLSGKRAFNSEVCYWVGNSTGTVTGFSDRDKGTVY